MVYHPEEFTAKQLEDIKNELRKLNTNVEKLASFQSSSGCKYSHKGSFCVKCKDNLVWRSKVDDAAMYRMIFIIDEEEVCSLDFDRNTRYYLFGRLPKDISYSVKIIAENRDGKEIVSALIEL